MSVLSELEKLSADVRSAYAAVAEMGGQTEEGGGSALLPDAIRSIPNGPAGLRTISVAPSDPAYGSVSGGGMAQDGMTVTVSATPAEDCKFSGWQEDGETVSEEAAYPLTVAGDTALTALFQPDTLGKVWMATTIPSSVSGAFVVYGGGKFVAVNLYGNSNTAISSTDGINWTAVTMPTMPSSAFWHGLAYGDGKFVATPGNISTKAAYSTDGINWTTVTMPISANWQGIAYGGGKFVATTKDSTEAAYSTDGINWTAASMPTSAPWNIVVYGGGKFVATSRGSAKAAYSTDGINWTYITMPSSADWQGIAYGDGKFVAVERYGKAAYSTDGINWTAVTMPGSLGIAYGDGKFVATPSNISTEAAYSTDGINWTTVTMPISADWQCIAYGGGKFVAMSSGKAAYSI